MILVCPGVHDPRLTASFLQGLPPLPEVLVVPTQTAPAYCAREIVKFLQHRLTPSASAPPIVFLAFSAGVVGAIGAAWEWQLYGGRIKALLAFDGWGVPLVGNFPIHRLSHDYFTHWSSRLLGAGEEGFYCIQAVDHLELWRSPQTAWGRGTLRPGCQIYCSAAEFTSILLERYQEL